MIDSTIIRAHQHAAEARKIRKLVCKQGVVRSRGGFSSNLHATCDGAGHPIRFFVTARQRLDYLKVY